jgi:hypothetical protein
VRPAHNERYHLGKILLDMTDVKLRVGRIYGLIGTHNLELSWSEACGLVRDLHDALDHARELEARFYRAKARKEGGR